MKLKQFIASQQLAACEPTRLTAFLHAVESGSISTPHAAVNPADDSPDDFSNDLRSAIYPPRPAVQISEELGLAVIPIKGMIAQGFSVFEQRYYGLCDPDYVGAMIDLARSNLKVHTFVFHFDSPGGYTTGVEELAEKIAALTATSGLTTLGYSSGLSASASYWLMAQCGTIAAAPSSCIGSIGVYCTYMDLSAMANEAGIKVQVFASGKYKGMGQPGTSLTPEQAAWMQEHVDSLAITFKAAVKSVRPQVSDETMQGQTFTGKEAASTGLVDFTCPNLEEFIALSVS